MIQPIVEGYGEVDAFPVLLRRLLIELGVYVPVGRSIRRNRTQLVREDGLKQALQLAGLGDVTAVLVLFDADDDCARDRVPDMLRWANEAVAHLPCAIVMACREYEAWFLAAIESLRVDAVYEEDPERKRDAKGAVRSFLPRYSPTTDQPAFSARLDLGQAYRRASSFRKLVKELSRILTASGYEPTVPPAWTPETPPG